MSKKKSDDAHEEANVATAEQADLDILTAAPAGPVECLGMAFPSDAARREHFLKELAKKLKDPAFRKIEGFPIGEDEDILALSDPPYYTACPNPWLADFVKHYGKPYTPKDKYHREPFAADVSEGKTDPLYKAHAYLTKVPHLAIVPLILHYTRPDDVVLDAFGGSGMTGVAARWCGCAPEEYRRTIEERWAAEGRGRPTWGSRRAIINDLSPYATFIAANYNIPVDIGKFTKAAEQLLRETDNDVGWMYETTHTDGKTKGRIDYTVWSEIFACHECGGEIVFVNEALDEDTHRVAKELKCPHCAALGAKEKQQLVFETTTDPQTGKPVRHPKRVPVFIVYRIGKAKFQKRPDTNDLRILDRIRKLPFPPEMPSVDLPDMQMARVGRMATTLVRRIADFFLARPAHSLSCLWQKANKIPDHRVRQMLLFFVEQAIRNMSLLNAYEPLAYSQNARGQKTVFYIPSQHAEVSPWFFLDGKLRTCKRAFLPLSLMTPVFVSTGDAAHLPVEDETVDYIFTDPPFGENIYYSDMNYLVESWHKVWTATEPEAIIDRVRHKDLANYHTLMRASFSEYFRVLKPGRWMTVVFSNSRAAVWNSIQSALQETGFVVANVSTLNKQQGSFQAVVSPTAVKQDLVISAYKPNGGLEERFAKTAASESGVWDFIRTHLGNLPVLKPKGGILELIAERDARILFDRTVAFYIHHGIPVPISSPEFQATLAEKFPERDGMYFLSDQAAEYDKVRMKMEGIGQLTIFVEDERSAVDWLRNYLRAKPSKYSDMMPEFFKQLDQSWKKWETKPELRALLDQYFLCYQGEGDVPPQIHSHLSTNFKELRTLPADHAMLRAKARDRWFVPDPRKNADVEQLREKHLLVEFWSYLPPGYEAAARTKKPNEPALPGMQQPPPRTPKGKRIAIVRSEAVRVGFNFCFARNDYTTIIAVAQHIPDDVIHNDEQLQMIYDSAVTRTGGETE